MKNLEQSYKKDNQFLLTEKVMNRLQFQREWFEFLERKNIAEVYPHPAVSEFTYDEICEYFIGQLASAWEKNVFPESFAEKTKASWEEMIDRFLKMQIVPAFAGTWEMPTNF